MFKYVTLLQLFTIFFLRTSAQSPEQNLDYFIKQGLQNSPLLKDYQNQINSASLDSLLVKAGQKPKVDANAQAMYAPVYKNFGYDDASTNGGNYTGVAGATVFDSKGTLLETETEIKESELPQAVKTALAKDFAGYKLDEIEKTNAKGAISYEMEAKKDGKKYEIVFDANGKLLKKEEAKEEKD